MFIRRNPRWRLPHSAVTPEHVFWNRRTFLGGGAAIGAVAAYGALQPSETMAQPSGDEALVPGDLFDPQPPVHPAYADAGRPVTDEEINSTYNNFYEFASHKRIHRAAQALDTAGWTLELDGLCANPQILDVDELIQEVDLEERVSRHRCVEAWSMVAPWIGFPVSEILRRAEPDGSARYVRFESFFDPEVAPNQRQIWEPWPYVEGLTIEEAANELSFLVVGAYGKVLPRQFGAPIRLHTPWKYGFKAIKSIVRITFTEERPVSYWEEIGRGEYGFWANVNPQVPHPRWSQETERVLGTDERIPTLLFNGYGDEVADLYAGVEPSTRELWF